MCIQRRDRVPSELPSFSDLLFRDFSQGMALYQQAAHQDERGNSHQQSQCFPTPPKSRSWALPRCSAQLLWIPVTATAPGLWSLIFQHTPVFIWSSTHKSHLCFSSDSPALSWKWTAREGANLTSGLLIFPLGLALGFQHGYTALILEKNPDLTGICFPLLGRDREAGEWLF